MIVGAAETCREKKQGLIQNPWLENLESKFEVSFLVEKHMILDVYNV